MNYIGCHRKIHVYNLHQNMTPETLGQTKREGRNASLRSSSPKSVSQTTAHVCRRKRGKKWDKQTFLCLSSFLIKFRHLQIDKPAAKKIWEAEALSKLKRKKDRKDPERNCLLKQRKWFCGEEEFPWKKNVGGKINVLRQMCVRACRQQLKQTNKQAHAWLKLVKLL